MASGCFLSQLVILVPVASNRVSDSDCDPYIRCIASCSFCADRNPNRSDISARACRGDMYANVSLALSPITD